MVDMPDKPAGPAAAARAAQAAGTSAASSAPRRSAAATPIEIDESGTTNGNEKSAEPIETAAADRPGRRPPFEPAADAAAIEVRDGLIAVALPPGAERDRAVESIAFAPGSAALPPDADLRLERFLAEAKALDTRIRVVGEADAPVLALERAMAVGVALMQRGVPANRLELTRARDASGDQARLFLAASAP
jgi:outer membrane protein OmpA-like peptidoglycan-associated protein